MLNPQILKSSSRQIAGICIQIERDAAEGLRPETASTDKENYRMLWTIFVILLILWILGFSFHVAGSLIHILLVVAVVVLIINLITGRRAV